MTEKEYNELIERILECERKLAVLECDKDYLLGKYSSN